MGKKISMLRKAVAGILSAAVFTGSVFTGTVVAAGIEETVPSSRQIVTNGLAKTNEDNVTVSKTVRETGTENEFEITLQVTTREKLEEIPTSSDAAVVLVMDTSGSMGGSRLTAAKKAAKSFVDKYVKDSKTTDKRYAALVEFANDAETIIGWTNLAQGTTNFENAIKRLKAGGGTNMEAGLQLAYNLINAGKSNLLKDCKNINVILLSDGCPTYHVDESTRNSTTKVKGVRGGGNEAYPEDWKSVETIAGSIRDDKINLYSVAFQTGSETFWDFKAQPPKNGICVNLNHWYNDVHGRWSKEQKKVSDWMNSFSDKCFSAKDADKLSVSFENIAKLIKLGAQAWKVTDPMGQFINYGGAANSSASEDNKYTFANNTLTWDLKNSVPTEDKSGDVTTYTYTLTYPITLNTAGAGFVSEKEYATNGTTTLYYYLFSKVDDSTNVPETPKTLNFDVPKVKGYLGTLSFTKVDEDGALEGAEFTLSGGGWSKTVVSGTDGSVTISGIPAGSYTLSEKKMDSYKQLADRTINVSYGVVTGTEGETITTITNEKEYVPQIRVIHKYGENGADGIVNEDPIPYVEGFAPTAQNIYNGERYTLISTEGPITADNGDQTYILSYVKYEVQKNIIVVHDYGKDGSYNEEPVPFVDNFKAVPQNIYKGERYVLVKEDAPYVNGNGDTVYVLHYEKYVVQKNIIVVHDYGKDGSYNEEPVPFVDNFKAVPQNIYKGERYVLVKEDAPYVNGNGDTVYVLHYEKYVVQKNIIVVHVYGENGADGVVNEDPIPYVDGFTPTAQTSYNGEAYELIRMDDPYVNGNGDTVYVLYYVKEESSESSGESSESSGESSGSSESSGESSGSSEVNPPVEEDTLIIIEKSWENAEPYDGRITFTATNEKTGRSYTGTLRAGRSRAVITVPAGGTYVISEDVPEGYTTSFPEGDTVYVRTGSSATIYVVNYGEEEEEIDDDDTPLAPGPVDPVEPDDSDEVIDDETTPLVNPPKTGAAVRGLSVLFGAAAAALVGTVVLRKKKEK